MASVTEAVHHGQRTYAMSRIPMRINNHGNTADTSGARKVPTSIYPGGENVGKQFGNMKNQLSPLQKLQLEYQEKLQLEKEKKMTFLYEKWSEEALTRVENHSGKRNHRYAQDENNRIKHLSKERSTPPSYSESYQRRLAISAQQRMRQRKPQKLPPINNMSKANSFHTRDPESRKSPLATPPRKVRNGHQLSLHNVPESPPSNIENQALQEDEGHSSPPPNIQHLRLLRERRLKQKKIMRLEKELRIKENPEDLSSKTRRKMTDFEKFQQERDAERTARLHKHYAQQDEAKNHNGFPMASHENTADVAQQVVSKTHGNRKQKAASKTFVSSHNTINTRRSVSPVVQRPVNRQTKRQEALRQGMENEKRIAELEREMREKQMDLKRMQEQEKRSRLDSIGNAMSGSENDSDHEIRFTSSQSHTPILKPVKVQSKRFGQSNHSIFSAEEDNDSTGSEMGFQMKPVIVRRDGSRGSNRSTPHKDKTYLVQKPQVKHNPRNRTFMSPNLKIREEEELEYSHPASPPLPPPPNRSPRDLHNVGYRLDNLESEENVVLDVIPCRICGRKFTKDRLAKHTKVCKQNKGKQRKVFNMTKARTQGTDAAKYVGKRKSPPPPVHKKDWRKTHENFINSIRSAKIAKQHVANGGKLSDLPPPPPSENPDYVKCQYCERKFDPGVAERHIPRCKDIKSRPKPPRRR